MGFRQRFTIRSFSCSPAFRMEITRWNTVGISGLEHLHHGTNRVPDARQILNLSASRQCDTMLLRIVSPPRSIGSLRFAELDFFRLTVKVRPALPLFGGLFVGGGCGTFLDPRQFGVDRFVGDRKRRRGSVEGW